MSTPLLRGLPLVRYHLHRIHLHLRRHGVAFDALARSPWCTSAEPTWQGDGNPSSARQTIPALNPKDPPKYSRWDDPDYRKWKDKEAEILEDIEPITSLTKEILHSQRYLDGERLTAEDEKAVVERLLTYHPHSEDKIGCGLDSIMVDRHPQFRHSRCLFVVRTDGGWIDFSYHKCLRAYIRDKYPSHAERFVKEHFKRGSGSF